MATTEQNHPGEFIVSEGNGRISRESGTIASGAGVLAAGTVLGKLTASGKHVPLDPEADPADGSEKAAGILYAAVDATSADAQGVVVARLAEVAADQLVWPAGIEAADKTAALGELAELNIIAR